MSERGKPWEPWPDLEPYARRVDLPQSGLSLFLYDAGPRDGAPFFLIHGLGNEADTWRHVIPALGDGRRVVAFDLPGFGRSDKPKRAYSVPFFRDVLFELQDILKVERSVLIGHSLGAIIAHFAALSRPERIERLVLISGSLVAGPQRLDLGTLLFLIPGLGEWLYARLRKDPDAAYRSLEPYYADLDGLPEAERDFLYRRVNERVSDDAQRRAFFSAFRRLIVWLLMQQRGLESRLAELRVPTTVIWGEADRINSPEGGRARAEAQPGVRLAMVPGAGHNVHEEKPEEVAGIILAGQTPNVSETSGV